jgi:branched-chain amino acid aminotransferase
VSGPTQLARGTRRITSHGNHRPTPFAPFGLDEKPVVLGVALHVHSSVKRRQGSSSVADSRRIGYEGRDISIPTGSDGLGDISRAMLDQIVGIQTGEIEHEWSVIANEPKA